MSTSTPHGVRVTRWVIDVPPPPTSVKLGLPADRNIDRWQIIDFIAPCFVVINVGNQATGTGAPEGHRDGALNLWIMNAMTPLTPTTTAYVWAAARDYALASPEVDAIVLAQITEAFDEDKIILELQQAVIAAHGDSWATALQADAGSIQARRFVDRLLEAIASDVL